MVNYHVYALIRLVYTYQPSSGACSTVPNVIGDRPNRACIGKTCNSIVIFTRSVRFIGVPIGVQLVERIVATVYCSGDYITEFITISPLYMKKTPIARVSGTTNQWYITLTWTPTTDQEGPQVSSSQDNCLKILQYNLIRSFVLLPLIKMS